MRSRFTFIAAALAVVAAATLARAGAPVLPQSPACPSSPVAGISPEIPADVCIPDGLQGVATGQFDDYSWKTFVALVWPADTAHRGEPARSKPLTAEGPRVFETFKHLNEIFHKDGSAPEASFDKYDAASANPCNASQAFGDLVIGSHSGIDDIGQAGIGELDGPLVAQNGRYVRTATFFNKPLFDHIVESRYYLRDQLPAVPVPRPNRPVIEFPDGSVAIKTAWVDVAGFPEALAKRFYTKTAVVKNATGGGCEKKTMGLIGMHIAQKTPSRPQWIWSSFEQRDTVPPKWADWPGAFVLNDSTFTPQPTRNPLTLMPLAPEPVKPFNVFRHSAAQILTDTELTSYIYQRLIDETPWRHYRLIMTQWPRLEGNQRNPIPPTVDGSIANTFPGDGAFSAFTNVTMETFDQHAVQLGCMSCHNRARMTADFMFTVIDHAYPPRLHPSAAAAPTR